MLCRKHNIERDQYDNCKPCKKERTQARRRKAIAMLGGECADCGNSDERVLEFDHLRDKERPIAPLFTGAWSKLLVELRKCELVCGNCHNIRTHERRNI